MRFLAVLLLLAAISSRADSPGPDHGCQAPERPSDDVDEQTWNRFLADVDGYRSCISNSVSTNRDAADAHTAAAKAATQAWNGFVHDSLNVREDFPWPPE